MKYLPIILFIFVSLWVTYLILKHTKRVKTASVCLVTGGVKTGKSSFAIALALREYKKRHFVWQVRKFFLGKKAGEEPLLYSNIPLIVPYVPVTTDILLRKVRINYKSVVYLGEFSLVADSQLIRNAELNELMTEFFKLFGHETHGGKLIADSQQICDCHYSLKRSLSEYFYIHHCRRIFWWLFFKVSEFRYSDDGSSILSDSDVEDNLKLVVFSSSVWKKFDCYCYSAFTDDLPI